MRRTGNPYRHAPARALAPATRRSWPTWWLDLVGAAYVLAFSWRARRLFLDACMFGPWYQVEGIKFAPLPTHADGLRALARGRVGQVQVVAGRSVAIQAGGDVAIGARPPHVDPTPTVCDGLTRVPPRVATGATDEPEAWPFWRHMNEAQARALARLHVELRDLDEEDDEARATARKADG